MIKHLLFEPSVLFAKLKEKPTWLTPFIIVSLSSIVLTILLQPAQTQIVMQQMQDKLSSDQIEEVLSRAKPFSLAGYAFTPLFILMKWAILSSIVLVGSFLFADNLRYKQAFSIVSHSSLILLLGSFLNVCIVYMNGIYLVDSPYDLATVGLNIFFSPNSMGIGAYSLFSEISVFSIWYIVVVAIGLMEIAELNKVKASIVSILIWLITTGFKVSMVVLQDSIHPV